MIFATDLDRTIIYSKRFVHDNMPQVQSVENINGSEISYMTKTSLYLIQNLLNQDIVTLIPVTARSKDEFARIHFLYNLGLKYIIVNNGGSIFIDGKEDKYWKEHIQKQVQQFKMSHAEILNKYLDTFGFNSLKKFTLVDKLVRVISLKNKLDKKKLNEFTKYAHSHGWKISYNGKKIYIMPEFINKWSALEYVRDKYLNGKKIISSGDSDLDLDMVTNADIGIVPRHGNIIDYINTDKIEITRNHGFLAGEEIIKRVFDLTTLE
ncbi:HAD hydrolase family protein [Alkaliphilus sp. B6464]|uniref:HAD hydrolase family protein n=1 Tax=Alkaliphilus sp. B6464 TaxID=2731219 RepID=UPI001BAD430C|nr:HAD hydrolase family protein [Alkaliphilus sp. B6464]QUH21963.1 HAD hydrolase family protein [Alkaliphilus sp. B6464]